MEIKMMRSSWNVFCACLLFALALPLGMSRASAQVTPSQINAVQPGSSQFNAAPPETPLLNLLQWDSILKEATPAEGAASADFVFKVSNPLDQPVQIERVQTSCGCTVATLPSTPWVLAPHTNGDIAVSVNLAGKSGTFFKTITVFSTNTTKVLTIKVTLPESPAMVRARNQQMALVDAQLVFRGGCADCHVKPAEGLLGKELYVKSCGICHDAKPRATMVSDLAHLPHPTDYAFWKTIVSEGKPRTMMPAFSAQHGGPLTDEQIDSLAKLLTQEYPSAPMPIIPNPAQPADAAGAPAVAH
jgi:mono/diheme cytochrome c family protein